MNVKGNCLLGLIVCIPGCWIAASAQESDTEVPAEEATGQDQSEAAAADSPESENSDRRVRRLGDTSSNVDSWSMDIPAGLIIRAPAVDVSAVTTPDQALNDRLLEVMTVLAGNPDDVDSLAEMEQIKQLVEQRIKSSIAELNLSEATAYTGVLQALEPDHPGLESVRTQLEQLRELRNLNTALTEALADQRLLEPDNDNAQDIIARMRDQSLPGPAATDLLAAASQQLEEALLQKYNEALDEQKFDEADAWLNAIELQPGDVNVAELRQTQLARKQAAQSEYMLAVDKNIVAGNLAQAEQQLNELIALGAAEQEISALRARLEDARLYGNFVPGQVFRDAFGQDTGEGPPMTVIPAGAFMMGSEANSFGHRSNEAPYHRVTFSRGFALSQREITVAEFRDFMRTSGYKTTAEGEGSSAIYNEESGRMSDGKVDWRYGYDGRTAADDMPVMHVSWRDAQAYVEWLSRVTSRGYRLPSEAELEYAIRGGTQSVYWWGDASPQSEGVENVTGDGDVTSNRRRWNDSFKNYRDGYWGPAAVASLQPNLYGLYDINGNLKEWSADCWHVNYNRAPDDGSAWVNPGCESRVVRGADWSSTPELSRSALRLSARETTHGVRVGLRVARDL